MDIDLMPILLAADEAGVRLEIVGGWPTWELRPVLRHQEAVVRIMATIEPAPGGGNNTGCGCQNYPDVYIQFPDGSLKRPDIAVFCRRPDEEDRAITLVPEAVIEVVSRGFEAKDLEIAPHFYISQGVKDVVIFDPGTLVVLHVRRDGTRRMISPVPIDLECGCRCTV